MEEINTAWSKNGPLIIAMGPTCSANEIMFAVKREREREVRLMQDAR